MIKNKDTEICEKCGLVIEPLQGMSIRQNIVDCENCRNGKKVEHVFVHLDCESVKIDEIPVYNMIKNFMMDIKDDLSIEDKIDE